MVGEHIRVLKRGRWSHAIDCGDETIIHLDEEDGRPPAVRRGYRPEFVSGAEAVEIVTHRQRTFPADEVVARAYSRIADPALAAMFRTSESFAQWCATGRPTAQSPEPAAARAAPGPAKRPAGRAKPNARATPKARPKPKASAKPAGRAKPRASAKPRGRGRRRPASGRGTRRARRR